MDETNASVETIVETLESERHEIIEQHTAAIQKVENQAELTAAADRKIFLKTFIKKAEEKFEPIVKAAHTAWTKACDLRRDVTGPAKAELARLDEITHTYLEAEETRRREEQAKAQAEADRKARESAEAERKRIAAEHEAQRKKEAEEAAKAEKARKEAWAAGERKRAQEIKERQEREAAEAKARREREAAEVEAKAAEPPPAVPIAAAPVLPKGVSVKKVWTYRIVNELEIPRQYLQPNTEMIRKTVLAQGKLCQIPGVHVYQETQTPTRTK